MAGNPQDPNAGIINLVFLGAIFLVFYFFIIRPQSKAQKEIKEKVENLKKGDKIVTSSGIIGVLHTIDEEIGRAHVRTPVTRGSRMPSSA